MFGHSFVRNAYRKTLGPIVHTLFFRELFSKTRNFGNVTWLGYPIWQNVLDLWTIQETIAEIKPALLVETGTNRGGSSFFYGQLFDLMGAGEVITVDVEKLHDLKHPRVTYLIGSSVSETVLATVQQRVANCNGPIMVILDSDHSKSHVLDELRHYGPMVTPGSYCLVQDGVVDVLSTLKGARPGPLAALEEYLKTTNAFEIDHERCERFLITHHPKGWLRRRGAAK